MEFLKELSFRKKMQIFHLPQAGKATTDDASNLPGMGGLFNHVNHNLYHYGGNNPVKYVDPDGRAINFVIGALVGFVSSSASEIGERMIDGQTFSDAAKNTFTDKTSLAIIGSSTAIGAVTSGVAGIAAKGVTNSITTAATLGVKSGVQAVGEIAVKTVAINTVAGAVDAGANDVAAKAITGENQSIKETLSTMGKGAASAAVFSGAAQGIIASNSTAISHIGNLRTGTMKKFNIKQPKWTGAAGVIGENVLPMVYGSYSDIEGQKYEGGQKYEE